MQFLVLLGVTVVRLGELGRAALVDVATYGVLAALTLSGVSAVMEERAWARRFELLRVTAVGLAAAMPGLRDSGLVAAPLLFAYAGLSLASILLLSWPGHQSAPSMLENSGVPR